MSLSLTVSTSPYGDDPQPAPRMPPSVRARTIAAATGAAMTSLTMTPFDVIKTRLQTQPPRTSRIPPRPLPSPPTPCPACLTPTPSTCQLSPQTARNISSLVLATGARHTSASVPPVCAWDAGWVHEKGSGRPINVGGFWDGLGKVWRSEGIPGLWKGVGTTLVMSVPSQTLYMLTYSHLLYNLPPSAVTPLISGILTRTFTTTLFSPLELLRTRLQATPDPSSAPHTFRSTLASLTRAVRAAGPTTLWRGLAPSLWRDVPFSGAYWALQHRITLTLAPNLPTHLLGPPLAFFSGFVAGTAASLLTNPFDVLKTRRQTAIVPAQLGTLAALARVAREEGMAALWVGAVPRTAKIAPACGIMIACYEGVARLVP